MSLRKASIVHPEADDVLDLFGFHHTRMGLAERLGARQIGASVYSTDSDSPTGPYHYHHGVEEWVFVVSGEPRLRDHEGQRPLKPGDVVCFPSGSAGAHTFHGPGTFVVFSTGTHREPWMSVYPDSGKVAGPEGILLASGAVDYWYGEGTWEQSGADGTPWRPEQGELVRQPTLNLTSLPATGQLTRHGAPAGFGARATQLGKELRAEMLGATLFELDPGEGTAPYHYHSGREEWLLVLAGTPALRHPGGEDRLEAGDVVAFVDGPAGAHRVLNRSSEPARFVIISTMGLPVSAHYPDSDKILIREPDGTSYVFRKADTVDYWDGER